MRRTIALVSVVGVACGAAASDQSRDREAQSIPILEEVFRYELQQFVDKAQEPAGTPVCLGVADDTHVADPPGELIARLARGSRLLPDSSCPAGVAVRLSAGPIEWVSDVEVRVKGAFRRTTPSSVPLVYRVVRESGRWSCIGPIIAYDPL